MYLSPQHANAREAKKAEAEERERRDFGDRGNRSGQQPMGSCDAIAQMKQPPSLYPDVPET
jgi:hypothetical protein